MDIINHQEHHYAKETLMRRLADASQYKIYPSIIPRNELPLRKILLTTRLWNHVRRQQAMLTITSDNWLFEQPQSPPVQQQPEEQEQDVIFMFKPEQGTSSDQDIPNSKEQDQWSWLDNTEEPVLLDSLSHEETQQLETPKTEKKRARSTEEQPHHSSKKSKAFIHHFSTIDSPDSPAGPASPRPPSSTSAVLLSA